MDLILGSVSNPTDPDRNDMRPIVRFVFGSGSLVARAFVLPGKASLIDHRCHAVPAFRCVFSGLARAGAWPDCDCVLLAESAFELVCSAHDGATAMRSIAIAKPICCIPSRFIVVPTALTDDSFAMC